MLSLEVDVELLIETEREDDGRWIADIPQLPGVLAYGDTEQDAVRRVSALALHVVADQIEHDAFTLDSVSVSFKAA